MTELSKTQQKKAKRELKKILGHTEPRISTPPLRELTPDTSLGFAIIEYAKTILKKKLYPWQEWLLIHAFEIIGDFKSKWRFRFRYIIVVIARQNGKTWLSEIVASFFLHVLGVPLVLGTAQSLDIAEEVWTAVIQTAESVPALAEEIEQVKRTNGKKELILTGNRRYKVAPTTDKGGRGLSVDLLLMDELRTHLNWEAWSAITPVCLARPKGIVWSMSNAGTVSSVVLRYLRLQAHKILGDPDGICKNLEMLEGPSDEDELGDITLEDTELGWFEWSAAPGRSKFDEEGWAEANPSLNLGGISSRSLRADAQSKPENEFKTESLCQWVETSIDPPFPVGAWEASKDEESFIAPDSQLYWGVDISEDRRHSSIAVCGMRPDRTWHVELVAYRPGVDWLVGWFQDARRQAEYKHFLVACQENGAPVSTYSSILGAVDNVEIVPCGGKNLAGWCGRFYDAVAASSPDLATQSDVAPVYHRTEANLDFAANIAATKALGDGAWVFNRKNSPADISPLFACAMAFGQATEIQKEEPKRSVYEDYEPAL